MITFFLLRCEDIFPPGYEDVAGLGHDHALLPLRQGVEQERETL